MKYEKSMWIAATTLAVLMAVLASGTPLTAQGQTTKQYRYILKDLGTLGGPQSIVNGNSVVLNSNGTLVGGADTSAFDSICGCYVSHAFKSRQGGALTDLGTLPGGDNFSFAIAINSPGAIAGISNNGLVDPITGTPAFVATMWKKGQVLDLGTLGGSFSLPNSVNNRGEAAGGAQNTNPDPFNFGDILELPSGTEWHATLWKNGKMRDLGALLEGHDSFAEFVNENGQATGISFTNSAPNPETGIPTVEPFFWQNGKMVRMGNFGGVFAVVSALNNKGQVVGTSDVARDGTVEHAFLWEPGKKMKDLGTFGGDFSFGNWIDDSGEVVGGATSKDNEFFHAARWKDGYMTDLGSLNHDICSFAVGSNSKGQIVGVSISGECDSAHPFLWENGGPMVDLNTLIPPNSDLALHEPTYINERGEITGIAFLANGDEHAFLLIPNNQYDRTAGETGTQVDVGDLTPNPAGMTRGKLTAEKLAALRARFTHRARAFDRQK